MQIKVKHVPLGLPALRLAAILEAAVRNRLDLVGMMCRAHLPHSVYTVRFSCIVCFFNLVRPT